MNQNNSLTTAKFLRRRCLGLAYYNKDGCNQLFRLDIEHTCNDS